MLAADEDLTPQQLIRPATESLNVSADDGPSLKRNTNLPAQRQRDSVAVAHNMVESSV